MSLSSDLDLLLSRARAGESLDHTLVDRTARLLQQTPPEALTRTSEQLELFLEEAGPGGPFERFAWRAVVSGLLEYIRDALGKMSNGGAEVLLPSIRAKAHAADILRAIALGSERPADLKKTLNLHDVQIHRVLEWAEVQGIVWRHVARHTEGATFYRLTPMGSRFLDLLDSPVWLSAASFVARECAKARIEGRLVDVSSLHVGGLREHQVARAVDELSKSIAPSTTSNLARALPSTAARPFVITSIIYKDELKEEKLQKRRTDHTEDAFIRHEGRYAPRLDVLGEGLIYQALERAGLATSSAFEEWDPVLRAEEYQESSAPVLLDTKRPIISLSSPLVNPITLALLIRFGSPCYFDPNVHRHLLKETRNGTPKLYVLEEDYDHAIVLRFIEPDTDISHFVLAGFKPSGTYAACRFFYDQIEQLLEEYADVQFGAIIRVRRGYEERLQKCQIVDKFTVDSLSPTRAVNNLDLRFLEVLAVVADSYPMVMAQRRDLLGEFRRMAAEAGNNDIAVGRLLDPTVTGQYTYERARALAVTMSQNTSFIDEVMLLLARIAAPHIKRGAKAALPADRDSFIKNDVLKDVLNLAPYSHRAVMRAIEERGLVDEFVKLCIGPPAEPLTYSATVGVN